MTLTRRECLQLSGKSLLAFGLAHLLRQTATATEAGQSGIDGWLKDLAGLGRQLGEGRIGQVEWQKGIGQVYGRTPLEGLMHWVDFRRLKDELAHRDLAAKGEVFELLFAGEPRRVPPADTREPSRQVIAHIAHVKKGRSIPPHGHSNMVSAFLILSGEFHVRLFDKLEDRPKTMIVRASTDQRQEAGQWSSISDHRGNVHWLTAQSDDCFLFAAKLIRLEESRPFHGRINIDVHAAKDLGHNTLEAPKISFQAASERY